MGIRTGGRVAACNPPWTLPPGPLVTGALRLDQTTAAQAFGGARALCTICQTVRPFDAECPYQSGTGTGGLSNASPVYTLDEVADFLGSDYWDNSGGPRSFPVGSGGTLTYDVSQLTANGQYLARHAFDAWSDVTGITFTEMTNVAVDITFDDENSGGYASYSYNGVGDILSAFININKGWAGGGKNIDGYHFQTYLHEIGHTLGLGHGGFYNGWATYGKDNVYANDSWQMTLMSYFSQAENTTVDASPAYTITPMMADILAVQNIYGTPATRAGNTVYGEGANSGTYIDNWLSYRAPVTLTLYDSGGHDTLDLGRQGFSQRIDLTPEAFSDVQGLVGNLGIARGTIIEDVRTGSGRDSVTGNDADNGITLGGGDDWADGGAGQDVINGGAGRDRLWGGSEADQLYGGNSSDRLDGGSGDDWLSGDRGADEIHGGDGADRLFGGGGHDLADGGAGDDTVDGGHGRDTLSGGNGEDALYGGGGSDQLTGDAGNDSLDGGGGRDRLWGGADDDDLTGGGGRDVLFGENGRDTMQGDGGGDWLYGGLGDDGLSGGAGNDRLWGDGGSDRLEGGRGRDQLWGGDDADTFVFANGCGRDVVRDFDALDALEVIDLSGLTAIMDWADLQANHLSAARGNCFIKAGGGDVITLAGVDLGDLDASDFLF